MSYIPQRPADMTGIELAIEAAGNMSKMAADLGITPQAVREMRERGFAPASRVVEINALYGVPREKLIDPKLKGLLDAPFDGE